MMSHERSREVRGRGSVHALSSVRMLDLGHLFVRWQRLVRSHATDGLEKVLERQSQLLSAAADRVLIDHQHARPRKALRRLALTKLAAKLQPLKEKNKVTGN